MCGSFAEDREPCGEEQRESRRVAAKKTAVIEHVRLGEHVGACGQASDERLERRPAMEEPPGAQIARKGQVAELVERKIPVDLGYQRNGSQAEQAPGRNP